MNISLRELDTLPIGDAAPLLAACCGAPAWVRGMLAHRPFRTRDALFQAAERVAETLSPDDWLAAFSHHPRIGEQHARAPVSAAAQAWSAGEQRDAGTDDAGLAADLREAQRRYEARFGYVFIICASGRTAADLLAAARARLRNDPGVELRVAAGEQRRITRLRLEKLVPLHQERPA